MSEQEVVVESRNGATKWIPIVGFIGLAAGVMIGLMYAPKEGQVTRRYVRERASRMGRQVKGTYEHAKSRLSKKDGSEVPVATS